MAAGFAVSGRLTSTRRVEGQDGLMTFFWFFADWRDIAQ